MAVSRYNGHEPVLPKYSVGVVGATGAVGQRFIDLLDNHPWFTVMCLGASERSAGKKYGDVVKWKISGEIPNAARELVVQTCDCDNFSDCDLIFSGLDSSVAGAIESNFAANGFPVFSNSKNHRYDQFVPILLPYVNEDHLHMIKSQSTFPKNGGFIVTNANCSTTGLAIVLNPIHQKYGITEVHVTTLQAISGGGYPGLPSMDIIDNVVPYIEGEEEKIEIETRKILGSASDSGIIDADITISASCHRVCVTDGHMLSVSVKLRKNHTDEEVRHLIHNLETDCFYLQPRHCVSQLPSCPEMPIKVCLEHDRPQPRLDRMTGHGMTCCVGRLRRCPVLSIKFNALSHNTIVGAAGGSILNAELAIKHNYIFRKCSGSMD